MRFVFIVRHLRKRKKPFDFIYSHTDSLARNRCPVKICAAVQPARSGAFDLATAFETVYFWPGLEKALLTAGFSKVEAYHHETKPWLTVIAKK